MRGPDRGILISIAGRSISSIRGPGRGISISRCEEQGPIHIHSWEEHIQQKRSWQGHIHIHSWEEHIQRKRSEQGHIHIYILEHIQQKRFWQSISISLSGRSISSKRGTGRGISISIGRNKSSISCPDKGISIGGAPKAKNELIITLL